MKEWKWQNMCFGLHRNLSDSVRVGDRYILAFLFLHEKFTPKSIVDCLLTGAGTLLMVL